MAAKPRGAKLLSQDAQDKVAKILDDPEYLDMLTIRAKAGRLPAPLEITLWHYRYGVPTIPVEVKQDLSELSDAELAQRATDIALRAREASARAAQALSTSDPDLEASETDTSKPSDTGLLPPSGRTH